MEGPQKIENIIASSDYCTVGHGAEAVVDGATETYWQSSSDSMRDYYRFVDLELDGQYNLSQIEIFNLPGNYYHYQVYASSDGENFYKIAYKNDNELAMEAGDRYDVSGDAYATNVCAVRVQVSYNSASHIVNLAEVNLYGEKVGETVPEPDPIYVEDFDESAWGAEYEKFENDPAYAQAKTLNELSNLVGRVIGEEWEDSFVFQLENVGINSEKDAFSVESRDGQIYISGRNGISLASGFNYY